MIIQNIDYDKQLDSKNGVYYDINGNLVIDESRVVVEQQSEEYYFPHDCIWNSSDCATCTENRDYTKEVMRISPLTSKETFIFERIKEHLRGHIFTDWYIVSPTQ